MTMRTAATMTEISHLIQSIAAGLLDAQQAGQPPSDEGAEDAEDDRDEDADVLLARQDEAGEDADDDAGDDGPDDGHR